MALDHGIINLPLDKRGHGSINSQIDRHKRETAKSERIERKAQFAERTAQKARLRALLDALSDERVMKLAAPLGKRKPSTARAELYRIAQSHMANWISRLEREVM